jgi:hypothetical protein
MTWDAGFLGCAGAGERGGREWGTESVDMEEAHECAS